MISETRCVQDGPCTFYGSPDRPFCNSICLRSVRRAGVVTPLQNLRGSLEFPRAIGVEKLDLFMWANKVLQSSHSVLRGFAGFRVSSKPVRCPVLDYDCHGVVAATFLLFPNNDMICGHTVTKVHGLDILAVLRGTLSCVLSPALCLSCFRADAHRTSGVLGKMFQVMSRHQVHGRFWYYRRVPGVTPCLRGRGTGTRFRGAASGFRCARVSPYRRSRLLAPRIGVGILAFVICLDFEVRFFGRLVWRQVPGPTQARERTGRP